MQAVRLHFYGYTWEDYWWQISNKQGIVIVYRGKLDPEEGVVMEEILHISSTSVKDIHDNSIMTEIKKSMEPKDMLFFSYSEVDSEIANDVKNLLVDKVRPHFNKVCTTSRNLTIESSGKCALLPDVIISNKN